MLPITSLNLTSFRSYSDRSIVLDPLVTLVVGPNATGKTNLLEALFVLATTKSFRAKDSELVHHGQDFYRLAAQVGDEEISLGYQATSAGTEKRAWHGKANRSLVEHVGTIRVVLFEPGDLMLVLGAPEKRRRYLDFILAQTDRRYIKTLSQYRRVLQQRNRILAEWSGSTDELFAWNIQLTELASEIDLKRREVVAHVNSLAPSIYRDIAGSTEELKLSYRGVIDSDYPTRFLQLLEETLSHDIGAGFTTIGPHRDDFTISFKGADITTVASRGEIRTVVLALKLAELAFIEHSTGTKPMLLLDDVFSELDDARRRYLLSTLGGRQALITTTNADVSGELSDRHTTIYTGELQRA